VQTRGRCDLHSVSRRRMRGPAWAWAWALQCLGQSRRASRRIRKLAAGSLDAQRANRMQCAAEQEQRRAAGSGSAGDLWGAVCSVQCRPATMQCDGCGGSNGVATGMCRRPFSQKQLELPKEGLGALFKCSWLRDHAC
jgi:hypothetical protein